jgi:hypothetical protein
LINDVPFLDVKTPRNGMLIFYQNQLGKNEMAGRASDINANGKYFDSVYFHIQRFCGSGFKDSKWIIKQHNP